MLTPKSLLYLIVPASRESSFVDIDQTVYPFLTPLDLGDYDLEGAQELVAEICQWLDTTIGPGPKWSISHPSTWWGNDDVEISMIFLFKSREDAVAFKLRWL